MDTLAENSICSSSSRNKAVTILLAEFIGTGLLVFLSCMASAIMIIMPQPSHLEKAIATGMSVAIIIQVFGHISEAHLNPAVTAAALVLGRVDMWLALVYVAAECSGAVAGYAMTEALLPASLGGCQLCVTSVREDVTMVQAVLLEAVATYILVLMVSATWDSRNRDKQDSVPLKFGFLVTTVCAVLDSFTGASMNPARSLGPAAFTGCWDDHWVYWVGPMMGSLASSTMYKFVFSHTSVAFHKIEGPAFESQKRDCKDSMNEEISRLGNETSSSFCVR
ncbi:aquaporin-like isoform X2 [Bacillus rossius redtenbacheri]|uniref:aquaporin-like isoform X2 n=1 Tax=Bacillus rossius redtenbacheri TaxID=93214 RepID=UPI002FDEBB80